MSYEDQTNPDEIPFWGHLAFVSESYIEPDSVSESKVKVDLQGMLRI